MSSAADNPQAGAGRPLPKKENDLFRGLVKHYEMKQYKKALKQAEAVLKKFPNHGETLAMKGLTLYYMDKKEEAHSLVKLALMQDMKSHVCWHVYGLLHRADTNYNEAIKAYKQALRIDNDNLQILRDLSMLQIQMRDLDGFQVTRNTLLTLKPNGKVNWMAFALSRHMMGDLEGAIQVIDIYLNTLTEGHPELKRCFESGELAMYRNSIIAEQKQYETALSHLDVCKKLVVDQGAWLLKKAEYELKLGSFEAAHSTVMELFRRGMTESYAVHSLFMCTVLKIKDEQICDEMMKLKGTQTLATMMPLKNEQKALLLDAYRSQLMSDYRESHAVQRIPTMLLEGPELKQALEQRCRKDLSKGVPSLYAELLSYVRIQVGDRCVKPTDPVDLMNHPVFLMIVELADSLVQSLESISKFSACDEAEEPPSTLLWAWFLRAGLYEAVGEYAKGVEILDKCLGHTPTAVDVYELKGRLLKAGGDILAASECLDKGRELDLQDRYINNQTTKYMLQAGKYAEARKLISLFFNREGQAEQQMYEMQSSWYELEVADFLASDGDSGRSLKKYDAVLKHFDDFNEDQFDFHGYCLRKVTLRAYVSVLRYEDEIFGEEYYFRAASGSIRVYLGLHDVPPEDESAEPDYSKMSAAERKKAKAIARKKKKAAEKHEAELRAEVKAEVEANKEKGNASNNNNKKGQKPLKIDPDPFGKEFLKKNFLDEARRLSGMLSRYSPKRLETWILQYDVAVRKGKPLMALQALHKAKSISPLNDQLFSRLVDFVGKNGEYCGDNEVVRKVLADHTPPLYDGKSKNDFISSAIEHIRGGNDTIGLPYCVEVAKAAVATGVSVPDAASLIIDGGLSRREVSVESCRKALEALVSFGEPAAKARSDWVAAVKAKFPFVKKFD